VDVTVIDHEVLLSHSTGSLVTEPASVGTKTEAPHGS
jgi:hypothetical protein